jgi:DNA-binding NarL/FixJ family response regulator
MKLLHSFTNNTRNGAVMLGVAQGLQRVAGRRARRASAPSLALRTRREREVLSLIAEGVRSPGVAGERHVSVATCGSDCWPPSVAPPRSSSSSMS